MINDAAHLLLSAKYTKTNRIANAHHVGLFLHIPDSHDTDP